MPKSEKGGKESKTKEKAKKDSDEWKEPKKYTGPPGYHARYERKRREGGKRCSLRIKAIRKIPLFLLSTEKDGGHLA